MSHLCPIATGEAEPRRQGRSVTGAPTVPSLLQSWPSPPPIPFAPYRLVRDAAAVVGDADDVEERIEGDRCVMLEILFCAHRPEPHSVARVRPGDGG